MNKVRLNELKQIIKTYKGNPALNAFVEILNLRREGHRDKLENVECGETRGRVKECKLLLELLS